MKTSLRKKLTKLSELFLGLAMGLGVAVGVTAGGRKVSEVKAANATFGTDWNTLFGKNYSGQINNVQANSINWTGTDNNVTLNVKNGSSTNGYLKTGDFRAYNGYTITLTAPTGNNITDISSTKGGKNFTSGIMADSGNISISNNAISWTGSANSVVLSISGTVSFATISATYNASSGGDTTTYSVTYNANTTDSVTGMPSSETGLSAGSHTLSTSTPVRSGYEFVGWNTDKDATSGISSVTIGSSNIEVFAIWEQSGGGSSSFETEVTGETNTYLYTLANMSNFANWDSSYASHEDSGTYGKVTLDSANKQSSNITDIPVTKGNPVTFTSLTDQTISAVTFKARQWPNKSQTIKLNTSTDGETFTETTTTSSNYSLSASNLNGVKAVKFTFSNSSNQIGLESIKVTFRQALPKHTVTYANGGGDGELPTQSDVSEGVQFTVASGASLSKPGYTFAYWSDGANTYEAGSKYTMGSSNVTLTAQWTEAIYNVTFSANGGKWSDGATSEVINETYKGNYSLPTSNPSRAGYTFDGWFTAESIGEQITESVVVNITSDTTFYAHWTALEITSISVNTAPTNVLYTTGDKFDPTGLVLNVIFSNNTSTTVSYASESSNFSFDPNLNTELGTANESVRITYGGQTCSQSITVEDPKTVTSIVFSGQTTNFKIGSTFVGPTTVTAKYNHGQDEDVINEVTITGYDMNTAGTQTVTVSYTEDGTTVSDTYTINVITISSFTVTGTVSGNVGGSWDTSNVVVKANWESVYEQETLTSDYTLTLDPATPTKGTTSVMVDVNYKSGLVSMTDVAELNATVINIKYDTIVWSDTNVTSYTEWNSIVKTTGVIYNGNTTKKPEDGHDQIQLRSNNKSGIWTSGWSEGKDGNIKSASLIWGPSTTIARTLEFYGRNTAYSGTEMPTSDSGLDKPGTRDLGTYLGCITWGNDSSGNPNPTSVSFTGSYKYVCAVGLGGAMYLDSITFGWGDADSLSSFSISGQKNSFELGDKFSLGDSYTATATYTESGNKGVTSGFTYQMGETLDSLEDITENYDITLEDNNKYVVVTYTDPNDNSQQRSATAYQISVDYAKATSIALTTAHGKTSEDPLVIAVGKTSDPITATIEPLNLVEEGILIDDEGLTHVNVNNDDTLTGLSVGDEEVTVYSADMEVSTTLYVSVTLAPGMDISDETLEGGSGGIGMLSVEPFNIPEEKTPSYVWTVEDDDPQGCVTVTEDEEDDSNAIVSYIAGGTATIKVEGYLNGNVFDTKYCEVAVTQSSVTNFEIKNANGTNGTIYTGNYDNTASFISEVNTTGTATKSVKWYTSNDSVKLNGEVHKSNNPLITDGNTQVNAVYNSSRESTVDTVTLTATSVYDSTKSVKKVITIKNESVTELSWTGGANIECFKGTRLDTSDWSFAATFASGDSSTPTLGSSADDVHVYIVEDSEISEEPTTLTPVSNEQELTANDNGYLVAFYKGYKCESTFSITVVGTLNNVIATYSIEDHGTKTATMVKDSKFTEDGTKTIDDLSLTLSTEDTEYYGDINADKGQQIGSGSDPATSMTLSTSSVNGTISKVTINTSGAKGIDASVSVSVGGVPFTCDGNEYKSISVDATPYEFTGSSSGEVVISWANSSSKAMYFKQIDIVYNNDSTDSQNIANTNLNAQKAVLDFIKDANGYLIEGCANGDGISKDNWDLVAQLYKDYFIEQNTENSDVFVANEADRKLAIDLLFYGVGGVWTSADSNWKESDIDDLQRFLKTYDTGISRYKMTKFIEDSTGTATRSIKPISNNVLLFGENSSLGEISSTTWIITLVAAAGLVAVGAYFYTRKRKEN